MGTNWVKCIKKPSSLVGGLTWHGTLLRVRGKIHKALPFPQWERKYLKSQAENKLIWPCDHPGEHKTNSNAMSFSILRGQSNTCWFLERPAKITPCPLSQKTDHYLGIVKKGYSGEELPRGRRCIHLLYFIPNLIAEKAKWSDNLYQCP